MLYNTVRPQYSFLYTDKTPNKVIVACRSGGKTVAAIQYMMYRLTGSHKKNYSAVWFSQNMKMARNITKPIIADLLFKNDKLEWKFDSKDDLFSFESGSATMKKTIQLMSYETRIDSARGMHPDLIILDEASLMQTDLFNTIITPSQAHLGGAGEILMTGTPKGHNMFWELHNLGRHPNDRYKTFVLPAYESGLLDKKFLDSERDRMSKGEFEQEYECNFDVAWGDEFVFSKTLYGIEDHISDFYCYNPDKPVYIAIDQGHSDLFACWFFQFIGTSLIFIDYFESKGKIVHENIATIQYHGYPVAGSVLPHDTRAISGAAETTIEQVFADFHLRPFVPNRTDSVVNELQYVKKMLTMSFFNASKCKVGLDHLRNYRTKVDPESGLNTMVPVHDVHSNAADAMRYVWEGREVFNSQPVAKVYYGGGVELGRKQDSREKYMEMWEQSYYDKLSDRLR